MVYECAKTVPAVSVIGNHVAALSFGEGTGRLFGSHWRCPVNTVSLTSFSGLPKTV